MVNGRTKGTLIKNAVCYNCGKKFHKKPNLLLKYKRSFCSRDCYDECKVGSGNPHWKGGRVIMGSGRWFYYRVKRPNHPCAVNGYVYEHRIIYEKHLGRILTPEEIIHHKDGDTFNNSIDNLELLTSSVHTKHHNKFKLRGNDGKFIKEASNG